MKKVLLGIGALLGLVLVGGLGFGMSKARAFDASVDKVWAVAPLAVQASADPAVLARGEHLARSIGGCTACHGEDLGGGIPEEMGPVGTLTGPNLTRGAGGVGGKYDAGTMARAVSHGLRHDGRTVLFMPAQDFAWWPLNDLQAVASYVLSVPAVDREAPPSQIGLLGKVLDRVDAMPLDVARRIDHNAERPAVLPPEPTAAYGEKIARVCTGCHGAGLSGGPLPGAPPSVPAPSNLTPHDTGLAAWSEADFRRMLDTGVKPDGSTLDPFMPQAQFAAMDDTEKTALWAYLRSLPPQEYGGR